MTLKVRLPALRRAGHGVNVLQQTSRSSRPDARRREKGNIKSRSVRRTENVLAAALDAFALQVAGHLRLRRHARRPAAPWQAVERPLHRISVGGAISKVGRRSRRVRRARWSSAAAAGRPTALTSIRWNELPRGPFLPSLYPRPEPSLHLCGEDEPPVSLHCASAQECAHNGQAVNSQHLVFLSL
jgi:hypothetical protein